MVRVAYYTAKDKIQAQQCFFSIFTDTERIEVGYDPTYYTTSEGMIFVDLNIFTFSHPVDGAPRPFSLVVNTLDGTASML